MKCVQKSHVCRSNELQQTFWVGLFKSELVNDKSEDVSSSSSTWRLLAASLVFQVKFVRVLTRPVSQEDKKSLCHVQLKSSG